MIQQKYFKFNFLVINFLIGTNFKLIKKDRNNKIMTETKKIFDNTKSTNFDSKYTTNLSWVQPTSDDNPETLINSNTQYKKIYLQFLRNNTKTKGVAEVTKQKMSKQAIKSFISKSLQVRKRNDEFKDKFHQQYKVANKRLLKTGYKKLSASSQKIGETEQKKGQQQKNMFFSQTKKVIQLEEQAMLLQYYYKDKNEFAIKNYLKNQRKITKNAQEQISNISYLRNHSNSQRRHKRFEPNKSQLQSLMLTHNLPYFEKIKKINFFKQQKFDNECFKRAQMNYQWKRQKNFQQMQQIIKLNRDNLLLESVSKVSSQQKANMQKKFNQTMRFFLKFAYLQQIKRAFYEYIDNQGIEEVISFIVTNQFSPKIKQSALKQMIGKIIKHKIQQKIEFYDFMEFIDTINETFCIDLLELVSKKYPQYFTKSQQLIINNNLDQITKQDEQQKISFTVKLIFQSCPQRIVLNQFLPVKIFPKILSKVGITGIDIPRARLFQFLYWNQKRPEGLNFQQFYHSFLMLGVANNNWENLHKLLEKVKLNQLIHS